MGSEKTNKTLIKFDGIEDQEGHVVVEYDDGIFITMPFKKYKNFETTDKAILLSINQYSTGVQKRFIKIGIIIFASGKLSFSFVEPIKAIEEPLAMEKVILDDRPKVAVNHNRTAPDSPGDDDDNGDDKWNLFLITIGFLGAIGYHVYEEEINDFCSKVLSSISDFIAGENKIIPPVFEHTPDGMNCVDLGKYSVKEIMLQVPLLIYKAQKERIHQAVFKKYNLTKPLHLVAAEIKAKSLNKINELVVNPILKDKITQYVLDVISIITETNQNKRLESIKKAIDGLRDVFGNLRNTPDAEITKLSKIQMEKKRNLEKIYDEILGKNTPKSDQ